ncbi:conserved hypothetical protein [delta proteobacterium NaphS2]|nr:conserved hypothetical protein [delta proteobacterium NaphS2]
MIMPSMVAPPQSGKRDRFARYQLRYNSILKKSNAFPGF